MTKKCLNLIKNIEEKVNRFDVRFVKSLIEEDEFESNQFICSQSYDVKNCSFETYDCNARCLGCVLKTIKTNFNYNIGDCVLFRDDNLILLNNHQERNEQKDCCRTCRPESIDDCETFPERWRKDQEHPNRKPWLGIFAPNHIGYIEERMVIDNEIYFQLKIFYRFDFFAVILSSINGNRCSFLKTRECFRFELQFHGIRSEFTLLDRSNSSIESIVYLEKMYRDFC